MEELRNEERNAFDRCKIHSKTEADIWNKTNQKSTRMNWSQSEVTNIFQIQYQPFAYYYNVRTHTHKHIHVYTYRTL